MATGDEQEAIDITAVLTGYVTGALHHATSDPHPMLRAPVTIDKVEPEGIIEATLASGMHVTITVKVDAVEQAAA